MKIRHLIVLSVLFFPAVSFAQTRVPIEITHAGDDAGGHALVQAVREAIQGFQATLKSPDKLDVSDAYGMRLTTQLSRPRIKLQLVTGNADSAGRTAVAVS